MDIDLIVIFLSYTQFAKIGQGLGRKGLMDFNEVQIVNGQFRLLEHFFDGARGRPPCVTRI